MSSLLQIAVIGCGYWGPNVVRTFSGLDSCGIKTVCDKQKGRLEFIQKQFPHIAVTTEVEKVLRDPEIHAVAIATPIETHFEVIREALLAGKHVLVEKPLTHSSRSAEEVLSLAESQRLVLMAGHVFQFSPAVQKMKTLFEEEHSLMDLCLISTERMNFPPPNARVDILWDLGPHDTSILLYLLGERPRSVRTTAYRLNHQSLVDTAFIDLVLQNNLHAFFHWNWHSPLKTRRMTFFGREKMIIYDDLAVNPLQIISGLDTRVGLKKEDAKPITYGVKEIVHPSVENYPPLQKECEHFIDCIVSKKQPLSGGANALDVVRILEAASLSAKNGGGLIQLI